jgi:serine/threonine-protein kinase
MVMAIVYAHTGDHEAAIDLLEELLTIPGNITANLLKLDPYFDPLRDNPRFQALIEKGDVVF